MTVFSFNEEIIHLVRNNSLLLITEKSFFLTNGVMKM